MPDTALDNHLKSITMMDPLRRNATDGTVDESSVVVGLDGLMPGPLTTGPLDDCQHTDRFYGENDAVAP